MKSQQTALWGGFASGLILAFVPLGGQSAFAQTNENNYNRYAIALVGVSANPGFIAPLDLNASGAQPYFAAASASTTHAFTGMDSRGTTQTMQFDGATDASSDFITGMHCATSARVQNSYFNPANADFSDYNGSIVDPNGSPAALVSLGFAGFNDTLQYGGTLANQSGYTARYIFRVDGMNSGIGYLADLAVNVDANPGDAFFAYSPGYTVQTWVTRDYAINGVTPQKINAQFSTQTVLDLFSLTDGGNYSGSSDFSSTVKFVGIEVRDPSGNIAAGVTVTSASGTNYPIISGVAAAPEPGSLALLFSPAAFAVGFVLRRRRSAL